MKTPPLSFDQLRRQIRRDLFLKRQLDQDHSEARLFADGKLLDALLVEAGYELIYPTEWSRHFDEKRHEERQKNQSKKPLEGSNTHSNSELMVEQS